MRCTDRRLLTTKPFWQELKRGGLLRVAASCAACLDDDWWPDICRGSTTRRWLPCFRDRIHEARRGVLDSL